MLGQMTPALSDEMFVRLSFQTPPPPPPPPVMT